MKVKNGIKQRDTIALRLNDEYKNYVAFLSDDCMMNIGAVMKVSIKDEYLKQKGLRSK